MELSNIQLNRLFTLLGALRDEVITQEEFEELSTLLKNYPQAQELYIDYVYLCTDLCNLQAAIRHTPVLASPLSCGDEEPNDSGAPLTLEFLQILGDYEKEVEAVELPPVEMPSPQVPRPAIAAKSRPQVSKLSLFALFASMAALLMILIYPLVFPAPQSGVASVSDTLGAAWSSREPLEKGTRLSAGAAPVQLIKGLVKIQTDNGVHLVIEAPAEFRFVNSDELSMTYGRVFVNIRQAPNGFAVQTQKSKIIDMGTQFGVYTDMRGDIELHVFEGKTVLIAGLSNKTKQVLDVIAGQAKRFGESGTEVQSIRLSEQFFARDIQSQNNLIWRQEKQIDLADIVGGGTGLGTGQKETGINPSNRPADVPGEMRDRRSGNAYNKVPGNPYIDGVFVPNGTSPQVVSSAGHLFRECPVTSGYFFADILHSPAEKLLQNSQKNSASLQLGSVDYNNPEKTFLCMHANSGITFDLNAIRSRLQTPIRRFTAQAGLLDFAPRIWTPAMRNAGSWWTAESVITLLWPPAGPKI
ncbi:MAG TPA: FecR domain-containing protein [Anaerohalosphaeraceae bacterium]|nr:FecR domain-containing protein [Anaerohalosphaeraceae bacterium]